MNVLLNRDFQIPADGWFQIVPLGEHRLRLNRKTDGAVVSYLENRGVVFPAGDRVSVIQVVDREAVVGMLNAFQREMNQPPHAGLLVDEDHFSEDAGKSTAARGWIENVEARDDGLYARIRFVDETDVTRGRFRFLSPVFDPADVVPVGQNKVRPMRLDSAALTNRPNMRSIKPLSNREDTALPQQGNTEETEMKEKLLPVLGLAADASDDAIVTAVQGLANRATEGDAIKGQRDAAQQAHASVVQENAALKTRAEAAEAEAQRLKNADLERQVEADLEEFKGVIANRDEAKAQLLANREGSRKLLSSLKARAETSREPLRNRADARTPELVEQETKLANRRREQTALVDQVMTETRCRTRAEAVEIATQRKPELFG